MKIKGPEIEPRPMPTQLSITRLVDEYMPAFNGARLREACQLLVGKILKPEVTVGLSISGALTPAGFGISVLAPLIQAGYIDYIVSTGANLYHDMHYSLGLPLYRSSPFVDDRELRKREIVRIYDIVIDFESLLSTDRFCYVLLESGLLKGKMSTARMHHRMGKLISQAEKELKRPYPSLMSAAYQADVPIFTSSPGDSTIGLNIAAKQFRGLDLEIDVTADVNETTAIVFAATRESGKSGVVILGGGANPPGGLQLHTEASGFTYSRLFNGVRIYKKSGARTLALCGIYEAEVMKMLAGELGVQEGQVITETKSGTTMENATELAKLLPSAEKRQIGLVTSALHMLRSENIFTKLFPNDTIVPIPANYIYSPFWYYPKGFIPSISTLSKSNYAIHEWIGIVYYSIRY